MKTLTYLLIPLAVFHLFSCSTTESNDNTPNYNVIEKYNIDSTKLTYQYYQTFGFGEKCEDLRLVFNMNKEVVLKSQLPISQKDLKRINGFDNKADKLEGTSISFNHNSRAVFNDIELEYIKFIKDTSVSINLLKGTYEIETKEFESTLKVYDTETNNLYIETHRCDDM